jgi:hypothetical protein
MRRGDHPVYRCLLAHNPKSADSMPRLANRLSMVAKSLRQV